MSIKRLILYALSAFVIGYNLFLYPNTASFVIAGLGICALIVGRVLYFRAVNTIKAHTLALLKENHFEQALLELNTTLVYRSESYKMASIQVLKAQVFLMSGEWERLLLYIESINSLKTKGRPAFSCTKAIIEYLTSAQAQALFSGKKSDAAIANDAIFYLNARNFNALAQKTQQLRDSQMPFYFVLADILEMEAAQLRGETEKADRFFAAAQKSAYHEKLKAAAALHRGAGGEENA